MAVGAVVMVAVGLIAASVLVDERRADGRTATAGELADIGGQVGGAVLAGLALAISVFVAESKREAMSTRQAWRREIDHRLQAIVLLELRASYRDQQEQRRATYLKEHLPVPADQRMPARPVRTTAELRDEIQYLIDYLDNGELLGAYREVDRIHTEHKGLGYVDRFSRPPERDRLIREALDAADRVELSAIEALENSVKDHIKRQYPLR